MRRFFSYIAEEERTVSVLKARKVSIVNNEETDGPSKKVAEDEYAWCDNCNLRTVECSFTKQLRSLQYCINCTMLISIL